MTDDIVLLATASSEVEAGMWDTALQAADIRTLIRSSGPGAGAWASAATFEHNVFVRASDLARARAVLDGESQGYTSLPRARRRSPRVNRAVVRKRS
jgi:hypothetical protein